ncbi:MAG: glycosyltransferase [Chlamydiota bacterium]|nr:glycosyltransferase [Chlamydiota bacterium]
MELTNFEIAYWSIGLAFFVYFAVVNILYAILTMLGAYNTYKEYNELRREDLTKIIKSNSLPEISFVIPAFNESKNILSAVKSLLEISYRKKEIVIVNDGSDDDTLKVLIDYLELETCPVYFEEILASKPIRGVYKSRRYPEIVVVDKENGKRFDAINVGINSCSNPFFITIDADTIIDDEMFEAVIEPIFTHPETIAVGAGVRINNGCEVGYHKILTKDFPKSYLVAMQSLEYLRSFLMRQGWNYTGGNFCIAGAFAVFSREAVIRVGGFAPTFANDLEIVVRLQRYYKQNHLPYHIHYLSEPVAWTKSPKTYKHLAHQRFLWQRGTLESMWFHRAMFFNPDYGGFGCFVLPLAFLGEVFEPVVELLAYFFIAIGYYFGFLSLHAILVIFLISWGCTLIFSLFALIVEECSFRKYRSFSSIIKLCTYAFVENIGYRQMTIYWRVKGFIGFFKRFDEIKQDSKNINRVFEENESYNIKT